MTRISDLGGQPPTVYICWPLFQVTESTGFLNYDRAHIGEIKIILQIYCK